MTGTFLGTRPEPSAREQKAEVVGRPHAARGTLGHILTTSVEHGKAPVRGRGRFQATQVLLCHAQGRGLVLNLFILIWLRW